MRANLPALLTLAVYAALLIGVSYWASRRVRAEAGTFLLGGRALGPVVSGLAYAASSSSAWVLLGYSGFVYAVGPSALWMIPGILAGYAAVWLFAGPVLQRASREDGHLTLTSFLTAGAGPGTARTIRIAASGMIAFSFSYYIASQFQGAGIALDDLFGTGIAGGIVLGAAIILGYTLAGGFLAVSVINTVQGLVMMLVAILLPAMAFLAAGGMAGISQALEAAPEGYLDPFGGRAGWVAAGFVTGLMATGFGALGQPHLISWIMAARDARARVTGAGVAIGWGALVYAGMAVLGLSARALLGAEAPAEGVFFKLAADLLPGILAGIVAAAILSAIMSTVDSQLLVAGGAISHDLGAARLFGGRTVLATRVAMAGLSAAAVALTLALPATIFERTLFAWTALGASFGPVVVARALGWRPGGAAVLAAILGGFGVSLAFEFGLDAGPGAVWARTLPWVAGGLGLSLGGIFARRAEKRLGAAPGL
ncbi:sodium/proline symporter [Hyphomonas sp.]|uniref:sodium/proline symporter n=1 Tax=Hyphomonas sp. TaxID=87 RepID=UPI00391D21EE